MKKNLAVLFFISMIQLQLAAQNVGIGTITPTEKLTVQTLTNTYGLTHTDGTVTVGSYIGLGSGWLGTKSNHPLSFFTNNSLQQMTLTTAGKFGIGTTAPVTILTLHTPNNTDGFSHESDGGIILKDVIGGVSATFGTYSNHTFRLVANSATVMNLEPTGNVGIGLGVAAAVNKLQIGGMGVSGFNGNDLAIGNGTNATGIFQSNANLQVYSSTNIALMPVSGAGRVGINTITPRAPLEVDGNVGQSSYNTIDQYAYFTLGNNNFNPVELTGGTTLSVIPNVSIFASNRIMATEFDAFSDARIKDISGLSNTGKDLQMINGLKITDYSFKDKVKYGNKTYKKVIAQEVEKVYPQAVSKHTDFIPNVYQAVSKIEKATGGYLLFFDNDHRISGTAKKLQLLFAGSNRMQQFNIVAITGNKEVIIEATELPTDKIFVYGEEVDDFRTVDYEALTTLNISATQQLTKQLKHQEAVIALLEKRLAKLEGRQRMAQLKQ